MRLFWHYLTLIALLLSSQQALAERHLTCLGGALNAHWSGPPHFYVDKIGFPYNSNNFNAMGQAVQLVNVNPSNFHLTYSLGVTNVAQGNGRNEVWFSDAASAPSPAVTKIFYNPATCLISETDVIVKSSQILGYSTAAERTTTYKGVTAYGGELRSLAGMLLHELGHVAGLSHEERYYNIMGSDYTHVKRNGNFTENYFGEDASNGLVKIYGAVNASGYDDVGLTHWERSGANNGYSTHTRVPLFNISGVKLPCIPQYGSTCNGSHTEGEQYYQVKKGQSVNLRLGYENTGRDAKTVNVSYYLSTDKLITTSDIVLGKKTYTLTRDLPNYYDQALVVPNNLVSGGMYYLGAIIDYDERVSEIDERNNASYTGIKIF